MERQDRREPVRLQNVGDDGRENVPARLLGLRARQRLAGLALVDGRRDLLGDAGEDPGPAPRLLEDVVRGLDERLAGSERCTCCNRTPLVGERVYVYASGTIACELCRERQRENPVRTRTVHGPEFGHTMRITDQRAAA